MNHDNRNSLPALPMNAWMLGWLGVLPFLMSYIGILMGHEKTGLMLFVGYGAVILSFLGGIRWAQALAGQLSKVDFLYSVAPSLLAWASLSLGAVWALIGLMVGFACMAYLDTSGRPLRAPKSFISLRLGLSVAVVSLHFAVLCTLWFRN